MTAAGWVPAEDDVALEEEAHRRASEALASLDEATRAARLPIVKAGILKSLRSQRGQAQPAPGPPGKQQAKAAVRPSAAGATPKSVTAEAATPSSSSRAGVAKCRTQQRPARTQACGDETWFADGPLRERLLQAAAAAHAAHKIVVAAPAEEIRRILPSDPGRPPLAAGAVLRLGGAVHGGFGEADIKSVYRQLSRALHPDKNLGVPEAPEAFKRLSDCAEELKKTVADTQRVLQRFCLAVGATVTPAMLERPQSPLLAEATRLMLGVLALSGEGTAPPVAKARSLAAMSSHPVWAGLAGKPLLPEWYESEDLLDLFGGAALRSAYDCSPKRFRLQFLCLLNRIAAAEASRNDSCVRGTWTTVLAQYPEVALWRDILDKLRRRVSLSDKNGLAVESCEGGDAGTTEADEDKYSTWALWWRTLLTNVLPCGEDASIPLSDKEVGLLSLALWEDFAEWASKDGMEKHFSLFAADPSVSQIDAVAFDSATNGNGSANVEVKWAYVPTADLLLCVGDGLVGITAEGICLQGKKPSGSPSALLTFAAALRRQRRGSEKRGLTAPSDEQKAKKAKLSKDPTRVVLLTNLVGAGDVDADLESETAEEAAKYGKLLKCTIREVAGAPDNEAVRIFLEFEKVQAAAKAYSDMNGRYFGGRAVKARFFDEERYRRGDLDRRSNSSVLLLTNLVAPEDADDELESETLEEARARFGKMRACRVAVIPGAREQEAVRVFLDFERPEDAAKALPILNGSIFGGREVKARYYDEDRFRSGDLQWSDPAWVSSASAAASQEESSKKPKKKKSTFI